MPPKRKVRSDEFVVSDDEEVVDDAASAEESPAGSGSGAQEEEEEEEEEEQPKKKKAKSASGSVAKGKDQEKSEGGTSSSSSTGSWAKDGDGRPHKSLTGSKRVTISNFRGKTFVDVREYYSDKSSGEMKPGKKGIALNLDDWAALKGMMGEIDSHIK